MIRAAHAAPCLAAALMLVGACRQTSSGASDAPASTAATSAPPAPPPVDHLGIDELIEGTDKAFGLVLPRGLMVERRYPDLVSAAGPMTVHALVQYLRPRLKGGVLRESENVATFEHVTTPGLEQGVDLTIRLRVAGVNRTRVDLSTTITPPAPVLPDVPSRWRQVGLTPEGRILDPSHLD